MLFELRFLSYYSHILVQIALDLSLELLIEKVRFGIYIEVVEPSCPVICLVKLRCAKQTMGLY